MIDPRISLIQDRIKNIGKIIAVSSGKGGVGKSLIASTLSLILARKGYEVGLFDLDFTSPSTHLILGVKELEPIEDKGIIPPTVHGLKYMSITYYSMEKAVPLRGNDFSNALIELFSITRWGDLDFLIVDMPPGIGDATLDIIRFMNGVEFLIVTTPSILAFETVRKLVRMLKDLGISILGVVENMKTGTSIIKQEVSKMGVRFLGEIPYDPKVEEKLGSVHELLETNFSNSIEKILAYLQE